MCFSNVFSLAPEINDFFRCLRLSNFSTGGKATELVVHVFGELWAPQGFYYYCIIIALSVPVRYTIPGTVPGLVSIPVILLLDGGSVILWYMVWYQYMVLPVYQYHVIPGIGKVLNK